MLTIKRTLSMNAKAFIIPNSLSRATELISESARKSRSEFCSQMCEINGAEKFDPDKDLIVQLWFHSEEARSENLVDHGFIVMDGDNEKLLRPAGIEFLPIKLFEGKKEGDTFLLRIPYEDFSIEMNLTLDQKNYRYGRYGAFEECLQELIDAKAR